MTSKSCTGPPAWSRVAARSNTIATRHGWRIAALKKCRTAGYAPPPSLLHRTCDVSNINTLSPKLISFDVFGTLISVRDSSYGAFERILSATDARNVDVKEFWEAWEHRNIGRYWQPYQS